MRKILHLFVFCCFLATAFATHTCTTCYIAASGCADTNAGSVKGSPWCHAPGMPNATSNASTQVPVAGDSYIFRGGDSWHFGNTALASSSGGTWQWQWAGSSGSPIYIGVDRTWFSGGSWVRPIITGDNPLSSSFVASCSFDNYAALGGGNGQFFQTLGGVSYVTLDNFDFQGRCWAGTSGSFGGMIYLASTPSNFIFSNNYCHGWTTVDTTADGYVCLLGTGTSNADHNQIANNVFDGSDSSQAAAGSAHCHWASFGSGIGCQSGGMIYQAAYDMHNNVFRYSSNVAVVTNSVTIHDNLFEYLYPSYQNNGPHPNFVNEDATVEGVDSTFYNNMVRHAFVSETFFLTVAHGQSLRFYGNVFFDLLHWPVGNTAANNCLIMESTQNLSSTAYFYNNTFEWDTGGCVVNGGNTNINPFSTSWSGTMFFQNDHFIGYDANHASPTVANAVTFCSTLATCTFTDNGHELFQTEAVANGQGYVSGNNFAPTLVSNSTVGAGVNLSGQCSTGFTTVFCSGTSGGVIQQTASGGEAVSYPAIPIVYRGSSFDIGAYQLASSGTTIGAPPFFGIDVNSSSVYPSSIFHNCLRLWDTNGAEWAFVNTAANTFTWTTFDTILGNAAAAGVNCVMMPLARTPNFASSNTNLTVSPGTVTGTFTVGETLSNAGATFSTPPTVVSQIGTTLTITQYVGTATTGVWTGLSSGATFTSANLPSGCHYWVNGGTVPSQLSGQCGPPTDLASNGTGTDQFFRTWVSNLGLHVNQPGYNAGTGTWAAGGANCPGIVACPHARFYIYEVWNEPESLQFFSGTFDQLIRMGYDLDCLIVGTSLINPYTSESCPAVLGTVGLSSPIDPTATVAMPSFTPFDFNHGHFESNFLYCNNSPATSCTVGTGHLYIQAINFHGKFANNAVYGNSATVMEAVADSWTSTVNSFLQPAELLLPLWNTEGGFSGSSSFVDCPVTSGAPPYCNFSDSGMQQSYVSRDNIYSWCDGYTMMTWYNWPAGLPSAPASAMTATAGWMLNGTGMSCATSPPGTAKTGLFTYTASWTNGSGVPVAAIWDNSQDCAGACTTTTQTVSSIYKTYTDLAGDPPVTIIGNQVPVGIMPLFLMGQQSTVVTPCARCLLY
jgi:hypothetical protein